MTLHQWLGILAVVCVIGFVIVAFRKGFKVKPDPSGNGHDSMGGGVQ